MNDIVGEIFFKHRCLPNNSSCFRVVDCVTSHKKSLKKNPQAFDIDIIH